MEAGAGPDVYKEGEAGPDPDHALAAYICSSSEEEEGVQSDEGIDVNQEQEDAGARPFGRHPSNDAAADDNECEDNYEELHEFSLAAQVS